MSFYSYSHCMTSVPSFSSFPDLPESGSADRSGRKSEPDAPSFTSFPELPSNPSSSRHQLHDNRLSEEREAPSFPSFPSLSAPSNATRKRFHDESRIEGSPRRDDGARDRPTKERPEEKREYRREHRKHSSRKHDERDRMDYDRPRHRQRSHEDDRRERKEQRRQRERVQAEMLIRGESSSAVKRQEEKSSAKGSSWDAGDGRAWYESVTGAKRRGYEEPFDPVRSRSLAVMEDELTDSDL
jgi:hypothetical protein